MKKIGGGAFSFTDIKKVILPESVKIIGDYAFEACHKLEKIKLPSNITKIGREAFWHCRKIKNVTLPSNLTEIGEGAFEATAIQTITIPSKVKVIGNDAFSECEKLKQVNVKSNVISEIGANAFYSISPKAKITVPKSKNKFYCELLKKSALDQRIKVNGKKLLDKKPDEKEPEISWKLDKKHDILTISGTGEIRKFKNKKKQKEYQDCLYEADKIIIEEGITRIGDFAFTNRHIGSITLPSTLTSIGDYAFYNCIKLKKIELPQNLTEIGKGAFAYSGLKTVNLPQNVKKIGKYAFAGCNKLKDVTLPASLEEISWGTFWKCQKLKKVTLPERLKVIKDYAFYESGIKKLKVSKKVNVGKHVLREKE